MRSIVTIKDFGIALKEGPYTSVGSYPVFFITADGGALSFATAWEERSNIAEAINGRSGDRGWRVIGVDVNWENAELYDDHTGERIESAYAEDGAEGEPAKIPAGYQKWFKRHRGLGETPGKYVRVPLARVVIRKSGRNWIAEAYDERGHLRSRVTAPDLKYVERKVAEFWPDLPIERKS